MSTSKMEKSSSIEDLTKIVEKISLTDDLKYTDKNPFELNLLRKFRSYDPAVASVYPESQPVLCKNMEPLGSVFKTKKEQTLKCNDYNYTFKYEPGNYEGLQKINTDLVENFKKSPGYKLSEDCKRRYIGYDMNTGVSTYIPLSPYELVSASSIVKFLIGYEKHHNALINANEKLENEFLYVTRRHHIISLAMSLFNEEATELEIVYYDGLVFFHDGKVDFGGVLSSNFKTKTMCYHGFALENLLSSDDKTPLQGNYYIFNKCTMNNGKKIVVQAELDAMFDSETEEFAELKCTVPFNSYLSHHSRKLLKMWVQTGLVPNTELLFGLRKKPNYNILTDIKKYKRSAVFDLLKKFNSDQSNRSFSYFNPLVASNWLDHVTGSIDAFLKKVINEKSGPRSFKLVIDKYHHLKISENPDLTDEVITEEFLKWRKTMNKKDS